MYNSDANNKTICREREKEKEYTTEMRYKYKTENERIKEELMKTKNLDFSPLNMKVFNFPNWKFNTNEKWMTRKGFKHNTGQIGLNKSVWERIP